jgi:hypothetical protein
MNFFYGALGVICIGVPVTMLLLLAWSLVVVAADGDDATGER